MPMVNPWSEQFTRPAPQRHTREFELPGGSKISLTFLESDGMTEGLISDRHQTLVEKYISGKKGIEVTKVVLPNGRLLEASRQLCWEVAVLSTLQRPAEGDTYPEGEWELSFLDWVGFKVNLPGVWAAIWDFVNSLDRSREDDADPPGVRPGTGAASALS
jgi:hypothetical protein